MTDVTATATDGTDSSYGVYNDSSSPTMNNVTATATGGTSSYGVYNIASSPTMNNVTATATGGSTRLRRVQHFVVTEDSELVNHRHHQQHPQQWVVGAGG